MSDLMFTGLETAEERLAICQRDSMAKREVIQRLKAEVKRLREENEKYSAGMQENCGLRKEVERLRSALDALLDANATREHAGMPREEWDAIILATEEALAGNGDDS